MNSSISLKIIYIGKNKFLNFFQDRPSAIGNDDGVQLGVLEHEGGEGGQHRPVDGPLHPLLGAAAGVEGELGGMVGAGIPVEAVKKDPHVVGRRRRHN